MSTMSEVGKLPAIFERIGRNYLPGRGFSRVTVNDRTFRLGGDCGFSSGGVDIDVLQLASSEDERTVRRFWGPANPTLLFQVNEIGNKGYIAQWDPEDGEWKINPPQDTRLEMPSVDSATADMDLLTQALELMAFFQDRNISQVDFKQPQI